VEGLRELEKLHRQARTRHGPSVVIRRYIVVVVVVVTVVVDIGCRRVHAPRKVLKRELSVSIDTWRDIAYYISFTPPPCQIVFPTPLASAIRWCVLTRVPLSPRANRPL